MSVGLRPLQGALEQAHAERLLQRLDVPAEGGLAEAERAGGGRERAVLDDGAKAAPQGPVGIGHRSRPPCHSFLYGKATILSNS